VIEPDGHEGANDELAMGVRECRDWGKKVQKGSQEIKAADDGRPQPAAKAAHSRTTAGLRAAKPIIRHLEPPATDFSKNLFL
jgi:hypothetical protein